jgi:catechol 2,3-dioxygenase-like lactoylglutathione lyase family enzyme
MERAMIRTLRVGALFFYVSDIDRTERFYADMVGLTIEHMPDDGQGRPWLNAPITGTVDLLFSRARCAPAIRPSWCSRSTAAA